MYVSSYEETIQATLRYEARTQTQQTVIDLPENTGITQNTNQCPTTQGVRTCSLAFETRAQQTIQAKITSDAGGSTTATLTVRIDNQPPRLAGVARINHCEETICSVGTNSILYFTLEDTQSGLNTNSVRVHLAGETVTATCNEEGSCNAQIPPREGQITLTAQDRIGNTLETTLMNVRVDTEPPEIVSEPEILTSYQAGGQTALPAIQPITIRIQVQEPERPFIKIQTSFANETGECSRNAAGNYDCEVTIQTPENKAYNEVATLTITDAAGNQAPTQHIRLNILPSDDSFEPNYWTASSSSQAIIDPYVWQVQPARVQATLRLEEIRSSRVDVVAVRVGECVLNGSSVRTPGQEVRVIQQPTPGKTGTFMIELQQRGAEIQTRGDIFEKRAVTCKAQIVSKVGNTVFTQPETETVEISLLFNELPPIAEQIRQNKQDAEKEIEDIGDIVRKTRQGMYVAQSICRVPGQLTTGSTALAGVGTALTPFTPFTTPAVATAEAGAEVLQTTSRTVNQVTAGFCKVITCDLVDGLLGADLGTSGMNDFLNKAGLGSDSANKLIDPYKSFVIAGAQVCIPALLFHMENYLAIQCQEQTCIQEALEGLGTPGQCAYAARHQTCQYMGVNLVNTIPHVNIANTVIDNVQASLANPAALVGWAATLACRVTPPGGPKAACQVMEYGTDLAQIAGVIRQTTQQINQAQSLFMGSGEGYCAEVSRTGVQPPVAQNPIYQYPSCNTGVVRGTINNKQYIAMNNNVYEYRQGERTDGSLGSPEDILASGTTTEILSGTAYNTMKSEYDTCINAGMQELEGLDSWNDFKEATMNVRVARQGVNEASVAGKDIENELATTRSKALQAYVEALQEYNTAETQFHSVQRMSDTEFRNYLQQEHSELFDRCDEDNFVCYGSRLNAYRDEVTFDSESRPEREEYLNTDEIQELEQEIVAQRERLQLLQEVLEDEEREQRRKQRELEFEALQKEVRTTAGFIRRGVTSARAFGQLGAEIGGLFKYDISDNTFTQHMQRYTGMEALQGLQDGAVNAAADLLCRSNDPPTTETMLFSNRGRPAAFISARAMSTDNNQYNYRIELAIIPSQSLNEDAILLAGTNEVDRFSLEIATTRTGAGAIAYTGPQANTVCLRFEQPIKEYFGESILGASDNTNQLCTQVRTP